MLAITVVKTISVTINFVQIYIDCIVYFSLNLTTYNIYIFCTSCTKILEYQNPNTNTSKHYP